MPWDLTVWLVANAHDHTNTSPTQGTSVPQSLPVATPILIAIYNVFGRLWVSDLCKIAVEVIRSDGRSQHLGYAVRRLRRDGSSNMKSFDRREEQRHTAHAFGV